MENASFDCQPIISDLVLTIQKLRKVVLEDELGICAELDAIMDNLINTYEDEWANVVKGLLISLILKKKKVLILFLFIYNLLKKKKNLKRCRPCETQTIQTIR